MTQSGHVLPQASVSHCRACTVVCEDRITAGVAMLTVQKPQRPILHIYQQDAVHCAVVANSWPFVRSRCVGVLRRCVARVSSCGGANCSWFAIIEAVYPPVCYHTGLDCQRMHKLRSACALLRCRSPFMLVPCELNCELSCQVAEGNGRQRCTDQGARCPRRTHSGFVSPGAKALACSSISSIRLVQ